MGSKKHKKHKSERREKAEEKERHSYDTKPPSLKLILKVGSSSTPEHSDSPAPPVHDEESRHSALSIDHTHHEKHKKSKKKKKKKDSKERHEKKHKHKRKREKDESSQDDISGLEETLVEPPKKIIIHEEVVKVEDNSQREARTCVIRQRTERSGLQKLLDYILKTLEKKDVQQFFAWPVTDNIAPNYSQIIHHPMDFSTMKMKIDNNEYMTLAQFVDDFRLMCNNAMHYNHPETIYYRAANKLLHFGLKTTSPEKLRPLQSILAYMPEIPREELGFDIYEGGPIAPLEKEEDIDLEDIPLEIRRRSRPKPATRFEAIQDDLTPEEILAQAQKAAGQAAARLSAQKPDTRFGFVRQQQDGTTSLNIFTEGDGVVPGTKQRPILLGQLVGKLSHGTGQLQGFREDRRNVAKPVKPLYYGAFSSYAPSYDSTFSNLTKEESELVYTTYGDEVGVQYSQSIMDFCKDCDYAVNVVDELLNILTAGEHSKVIKQIDDRKKQQQEEEQQKKLEELNIDYAGLRSLSELGIDTSFVDEYEKQASDPIQSKLDQTSSLIEQLDKVQKERLSLPPPPHLSNLPQASESEIQLAEKITESLCDMAKQAAPGDVAPVPSLRKAMGINEEIKTEEPVVEDTADLESELREFLENEGTLSNSPVEDDKTIEEMLCDS